ncbi:MAG: hypothetical protein MHM6MM_006463, partial [Cercozoa sp. M6MM]
DEFGREKAVLPPPKPKPVPKKKPVVQSKEEDQPKDGESSDTAAVQPTAARESASPKQRPSVQKPVSVDPSNPYASFSPHDTAASGTVSEVDNIKLQPVHLPASLASVFLNAAAENTTKDVETCGVLGAVLEDGIYKVDRLVLPPQTGDANSCEQLDETAVLRGMQERVVVGWIHTHPSQTAFLSSVDVHTQYGYQVQLAEAVGVVCAPSYQQTVVSVTRSARCLSDSMMYRRCST